MNMHQLSRCMHLTDLGYRATEPDRPNPLGEPRPVRCITCSERADAVVLLADCRCCWDHLLPERA